MRWVLALVLGMGAGWAGLANAQATQPAAVPPAAEVPVTAVILYSSGVGYFEHAGSVAGDVSTELRFKTAQINDILKSLVLQDLDGGTVRTITYPSQEPLAKTLKSFQVDLSNNPPLADLLNQLRGARVKIALQGESASGTILGVEKKPTAAGEVVVDRYIVNLITDTGIRPTPLDDIRGIELEDPQLQAEMAQSLAALSQARDQDKKPVAIHFQGKGDRRVRIGYVVETPIWKTSYRLILTDGPEAKSKLQGWAIVENQTDTDWKNVQLGLVSGRPISFVMDLYQSLYLPRPVVQPELYASLRPKVYEEGGKQNIETALGDFRQRAAQKGQMVPAAAAPMAAAEADRGFGIDASASIASIASAANMGELFQYTIPDVTLPRQQSAMLPIVTDDIDVERVSIYNQSVLPNNPLNGARLKNTTGKHLLQGPITVLEGSSYAGDARINDVPPGQERLLSYGIDLQMRINAANNKTQSAVLTGKIIKGVLQVTRKHVQSQDYVAENKSQKDKALVIEHPRQAEWKLVDTSEPVETTDQLYRFQTSVPAGKSETFTVKQQIIQDETIAILPADLGQLVLYSRTGEIPQPVRDVLVQAIGLKQRMVDTQRQIEQRQQQLNEITAEQTRIRENMRTVDQKSQYYTRLLTKLNEQETRIEELQTELENLEQTLETERKNLEDFLSNTTVG